MKHIDRDDTYWKERYEIERSEVEVLEKQLSRYQGGVEVEVAINEYGKFTIAEATACPPELIGKRIRVLVMKEVE